MKQPELLSSVRFKIPFPEGPSERQILEGGDSKVAAGAAGADSRFGTFFDKSTDQPGFGALTAAGRDKLHSCFVFVKHLEWQI